MDCVQIPVINVSVSNVRTQRVALPYHSSRVKVLFLNFTVYVELPMLFLCASSSFSQVSSHLTKYSTLYRSKYEQG